MQMLKVDTTVYGVDQHPDECPCCHHAITPGFIASIFSVETRVIDAACRCPRRKCSRMFIAIFERALMQGGAIQIGFICVRHSLLVR